MEHAQAGAAAQQAGHFDVAIQEFKKVVELAPTLASGHANLGDAYFKSGDYEAAIPELQQAVQINPKMIGTQQTLGVALLVEGNAQAALPHLEETHMPELLGLAYLEAGKLGSAVMALHAALERAPKDTDLLYYYGQATRRAASMTDHQLAKLAPDFAKKAEAEQRPTKDIGALQTELAKTPSDPALLYDFHRAAVSESSKAFDSILQYSPDSARAHQVAADRDVEAGHLPQAEQEYEAALRSKPFTPGVHLALGNTYAAAGDWISATRQYQMEVRLQPQNASALYELGRALLQIGRSKDGFGALSAANQLRPQSPSILLALGQAASEAGNGGDSEKYLRQVLSVEPAGDTAAQAHLELSNLYGREGKTHESADELTAYRKLSTQEKQ